MPIAVANTTLSLSQIDQLREIVLQTNNILGTTIDPFTLESLNKSDWWQYEFARQVLSTTLVAEGYPALPEFSISDLNNGQLPIVLVEKINASLSAGGSTVLLLVPTGAVESVDGEFQRFVWDGENAYEVLPEVFYPIWHAELLATDRQSEYQILLKMPEMIGGDEVINLIIASDDFSVPALSFRDFNHIALELRANYGGTLLDLKIAGDEQNSISNVLTQPEIGSVITLTLSTSSLDYAYDGSTGSIVIPAGFFAGTPNLWVASFGQSPADIVPLSIKVQPLSGA